MKPLHALTTWLLVAVLAPIATAQTKVVVQLSSTEGLLITSSAPISVERVPIQQFGTPIPPVNPSLTLSQALSSGMGAIADYPSKVQDRQALAFTLTFMANSIPDGDAKIDAFKLLKQAGDAAIGANASKWASWWATVNRYTAGCTNTQCKVFVKDIVETLVEGLPASSVDDQAEYTGEGDSGFSSLTINEKLAGVPTFGAPGPFLQELIKLLLPFLLQLLQSLFSPS